MQSIVTRRMPLILDGGMSRELIQLGAPFRQPEWSSLALLEAPQYVKQAHLAFVDAGADVITTNSYALVPFHIGEERFWHKGEELAALAGKLAKEVATQQGANHDRKILVAGSLPPIFGSYEPSKYDPGTVQRYLEVLVRGLAPFVDVWLGETLSLIAEAEAVRKVLKTTEKPVWIAFTLDDRESDLDQASPSLLSGELVTDAAQWALDAGVDALLFNCSSPESVSVAVRAARSIFTINAPSMKNECPLIGAYANSFEARPSDYAANVGIASLRRDMTPEAYLQFAREWHSSGASIIGGCCGIGHKHIEKVAHELLTECSS